MMLYVWRMDARAGTILDLIVCKRQREEKKKIVFVGSFRLNKEKDAMLLCSYLQAHV